MVEKTGCIGMCYQEPLVEFSGKDGEVVILGRLTPELVPAVLDGYLSGESFDPEQIVASSDHVTDEDSFFYFVGRRDDIIKSRGEKVSPKEVENVLYALPGVREAAVIGVQDPVLGQAIKAFVATDDAGLTEARVLRHCREHLEDFMVPRTVEVRQELPKTPSGKIKKTELH